MRTYQNLYTNKFLGDFTTLHKALATATFGCKSSENFWNRSRACLRSTPGVEVVGVVNFLAKNMQPGGKIAATLRSEPTNINPGASDSSGKKTVGNLEIRHEVPTNIPSLWGWNFNGSFSLLKAVFSWNQRGIIGKNWDQNLGWKLRSPLLCVAGTVLKASARSYAHKVGTLQTLERLWFLETSQAIEVPKKHP